MAVAMTTTIATSLEAIKIVCPLEFDVDVAVAVVLLVSSPLLSSIRISSTPLASRPDLRSQILNALLKARLNLLTGYHFRRPINFASQSIACRF